ncbi:MAG: helix-turn-helix transcriptional regulator [Clostridia bacterium]|nr:helix-turn-helix transcriptional regulator [Clostridia bacterium]
MSTFYEHREETLFIGEMTHYPFPLHVHEVAEIVAVRTGRVRLSIEGMVYELGPGDIAVAMPLTPHSYEEVSEDASGLAAIFPPDIIPEYNGTFHSLVPENPVLRAAQTSDDTRQAVRRLSEMNMEDDLPLCVAYLHVLLAGTLHRLSYRPVYDYNDRGLGYRIMHYISDHACEELTLVSAAHALGISASHLSHFFADKLQISFRQYINSIRIAKARLLMRDPSLTLTMICDLCGYTNMRTFRRAFQKEAGCLPSEHMVALRRRIYGEPVDAAQEQGA